MSESITAPTSCFTYEVVMIAQVFATSKEEADQKLDNEGGYVTRRDVSLKDIVALYNGEPEKSDS